MARLAIITSIFITGLTLLVAPLASATSSVSSVNSDVYQNYVAVGDSIASGAGLGADEDTLCDRSAFAYPHIVANSLNTPITNLACSGAKTDEGLYDSQERGDIEILPQIDRAFTNSTPDLMTITIGANDMRWTNFIYKCYEFPCGTRSDRFWTATFRADLRLELNRAIWEIYDKSNGNPPRTLITGYYNPLSDNECSDTTGITSRERSWITSQTAYLNSAIRTTASWYNFVEYIPVDFDGNQLCDTDPWIQGLNDPVPFHPTATGQRVIAQNILEAL